MDTARLTRNDWLWIAAACFLGLVMVVFAFMNYSKVFPQAAIEFTVEKDDAYKRSESFLQQMGYDLKEYKSATVLFTDYDSMTYAQKSLDPGVLNDVLKNKVDVWWWRTRWFKPLQNEEFEVHYSPKGYLVGFIHVIDEEATGADLPVEEARGIAQRFVAENKLFGAYTYEEVEASLSKKNHRTDHTFTFERQQFKVADAPYRISLEVQGDKVGKVSQFLQIPEEWNREYRNNRSKNELVQSIAEAFNFPLMLLMLIVFARRLKKRCINWKLAIILGSIMFVLSVLSSFNTLSLFIIDYPTTKPYSSYLLSVSLEFFVSAAMTGLMIFLLVASGETIYREERKEQVRLDSFLKPQGWRTKEGFFAPILGYCLALFDSGFLIVFYLVALKLGAWVPMDVEYSDIVNTAVPAIFPISISVMASLNEEFIFRIFAIPFLKKYLKSTALAVILPAFLWGFLHSNYPQEPAFIRGLEVGLMGIFSGLIFLRFGAAACLIWHYLLDVVFIGMFLFNSKSLYHILSGSVAAGIFLVPLVYAIVMYIKQKRFETEPLLLNSAQPTLLPEIEKAVRELPEAQRLTYQPLKKSARLVACLLLLVGIISTWLCTKPDWSDCLSLPLSPQEITEKANQHFKKLVASDDYSTTMRLTGDISPNNAKYFREREGTEKAIQHLRELSPGAYWQCRFFRSLQKEEWSLTFSPDGKVFSVNHQIPQEQKGDEVTREQAITMAESYVKQELGVDLTGFRLMEANKEQQPNRSDWSIIWESEKPILDQAYLRKGIFVQGSERTNFWQRIKLPEEWLRAQEKKTWYQVLFEVIKVIIFGLGFLVLLTALIRTYLKGMLPWRFGIVCALITAGATLGIRFASYPTLLMSYNTAVPLSSFVTMRYLRAGFSTLAVAIGVFLLSLAVAALWNWFGKGGDRRSATHSGSYIFDAVLAGCAVALSLAGWNAFSQWIIDFTNVPLVQIQSVDTSFLSDILPGLSAFADIARMSLFLGLLGAGLATSLSTNKSLKKWIILGFFVTALCSAGAQAESPLAFLLVSLANCGFVFLIVAGSIVLLRRNILAFILTILIVEGAPIVSLLIKQPAQFFQMQGILLLVLLLLAPVIFVIFFKEPAQKAQPE